MSFKIARSEGILLAIIAAYCAAVAVINPAFLNIDTLFDLIRTSSRDLILVMGLLLIMLSGGIDISFMAMALVGSYCSTWLMMKIGWQSAAVLIPCAMLISTIMGLCNACLVSWLKLPAFIITLGTMNLFHGLMATLVGTRTFGGGILPPSFSAFGSATLFEIEGEYGAVGLTVSIIPVIIVVVLTWFIIYKTMLGRGIVAIGNDENSAIRLGFKPLYLRLFAYGYIGALAGLAGSIYICQVNAVYPDKMIGEELMVVAGAVIGGTSISGGKGKIFGAILGVIIIYLLKSTLIFLGLSASWNNFFVGIILVLSLSFTAWQEKVRNDRHLLFKVESR